jgi:hypothetical protein
MYLGTICMEPHVDGARCGTIIASNFRRSVSLRDTDMLSVLLFTNGNFIILLTHAVEEGDLSEVLLWSLVRTPNAVTAVIA